MSFKFAIEKGVAIPAQARDTTSSLPFPWDELEDGDSFLVTKQFWVEERGYDAASFEPKKAKERIRIHFRKWQERKPEERNPISLHTRLVGDDVRVWISRPVTEEVPVPPPAEEAPPAPPAPEAPVAVAPKTTTRRRATK